MDALIPWPRRPAHSDNDDGNLGAFEGNSLCADVPLKLTARFNTDIMVGRGNPERDFDGPFTLLGGIYAETDVSENSYYVNGFGLDFHGDSRHIPGVRRGRSAVLSRDLVSQQHDRLQIEELRHFR